LLKLYNFAEENLGKNLDEFSVREIFLSKVIIVYYMGIFTIIIKNILYIRNMTQSRLSDKLGVNDKMIEGELYYEKN